MSEENLEIVRQVYEAAARRDTATILTLYDPEVELDASALGVEGRGGDIFRGHEGLRSLFDEWHESWGEIAYDYEELIDAGDQVISVVTRHARGRASGVEVEHPFCPPVDDPTGQGDPGDLVLGSKRSTQIRGGHMTLFGEEHIDRYVATDGREGHDWQGAPTLILTTTGRRSGQPRPHALIYGRDGDDYLVAASKGGAPTHPRGTSTSRRIPRWRSR